MYICEILTDHAHANALVQAIKKIDDDGITTLKQVVVGDTRGH